MAENPMKGKIEVFYDGQSWVVRYLPTTEEVESEGKSPLRVHRTHSPEAVPWLVQSIMVERGMIE